MIEQTSEFGIAVGMKRPPPPRLLLPLLFLGVLQYFYRVVLWATRTGRSLSSLPYLLTVSR